MPTSPADPADQRSPARQHVRRRASRLAAAVGLGAAWLALAAVGLYYVGGALVQLGVSGLVLLPRAGVWLFIALQEGADWWSIAGRIGAAIAEALTTSQVALTLIGLELAGAAALYGLQRLLRDESRRAASEEVEE